MFLKGFVEELICLVSPSILVMMFFQAIFRFNGKIHTMVILFYYKPWILKNKRRQEKEDLVALLHPTLYFLCQLDVGSIDDPIPILSTHFELFFRYHCHIVL